MYGGYGIDRHQESSKHAMHAYMKPIARISADLVNDYLSCPMLRNYVSMERNFVVCVLNTRSRFRGKVS